MTAREERLRAYLTGLAAEPLAWGRNDCCMMAARWVEQCTGRPLGLPRYSSEAEARSMIAAAGGLLPLFRSALARSGLRETAFPEFGDVALVETGRYGPVATIACHAGVFAWRAETGVTFLSPRPQHIGAVWSAGA